MYIDLPRFLYIKTISRQTEARNANGDAGVLIPKLPVSNYLNEIEPR